MNSCYNCKHRDTSLTKDPCKPCLEYGGGFKFPGWEDRGLPKVGRKVGKVDGCTDPDNCSRCKTHPDHRGDMAHAGISSYPINPKAGEVIPVKDPSKIIQVPPAKAATYDDGKPPLARLPWKGLAVVAGVQAYGHRKYGDFDNYRKGMEVGRNLSCAMRHISEYMEGQDNDPESGEPHLGHAAARLLFVLQNIADGVAIDDRYKKPS